MTKKKSIILVWMLVACMALSACNFGERKIDTATDDNAKKVYISPTTAPSGGSMGEVTTSLDVCGQEGILLLTASYYSALAAQDKAALLNLVSNPEIVSDEFVSAFGDVADIDVKCVYAIDGTDTIKTVAYVYYEVFFEGFDTSVPSLDELYITYNNGSYSIYNGTIPLDEYNTLLRLTSVDGVSQLTDSVNRAFISALDSDNELKEYIGF